MPMANHQVLFVNTRPSGRQSFARLGTACYDLPILNLNKRQLSDKEGIYQKKLLTNHYRVLVVVSATAAKYALNSLTMDELKILQDLSLDGLSIIAVGAATASVLNDAKLLVHTPTDSRFETNEGMLCMPQITNLQAADHVLIWKGVGGRTMLADTLTRQGMAVQTIAWYDRVICHNLHQQITTLKQRLADITVVLITSQMAFEAFLRACRQVGLDYQRLYYIALKDRLTLLIQQYRLPVQTVYELSDSAVGEAIKTLASSTFHSTQVV